MARQESDREDLLREATALRNRVELTIPALNEPIVAGFRDENRLSVYFGTNLAAHFDGDHCLRRAFFAGCLYRSQGHTLARLSRVRTSAETELRRHDLLPDELRAFLGRLRTALGELEAALAARTERVIGQVPVDQDIRPRLLEFLAVASRPGIQLSNAIKK